MAIEKMKYVNFVGRKEYLDQFIDKYMTGDFSMQPEYAMNVLGNVRGLYSYKGGNPCTELLRRCDDLRQGLELDAKQVPYPEDLRRNSFEEIDGMLQKLEENFSYFREEKRKVDDAIAERKVLLNQLSQISNMDADLSQIFKLRFFKIRFGRLPKRSYQRILLYLEDLDVILFHVSSEKEYENILYVMPAESEIRVDGLFNSLQFERNIIPDGLSGTPKELCVQISQEINEKWARSMELASALAAFSSERGVQLQQLHTMLLERERMYEIKKYVAFNRESFYIVGWIPAVTLEKMQSVIDQDPDVITIVDTVENLSSKPPTKLKNNRLFRPFEPIVTMYGLPAYDEVDPTALVAILYCLMVGFMFGDVGQGLVFFLAGLVLLKKKSALGGVFTGGGLISMLFGFLYGSFFSLEDVLPPLFMNPMESANINTMLMIGIGLGVVLLILGMVLNIINGIKAKDPGKVLFDRNGLAGLIFYGVIVISAVSFLLNGKLWTSMGILVLCVGLPFLVIFFQHPLENLLLKKRPVMPEGKGGFFMETIFEMVDMLLSFASNTISFVRLSAFAINHVGLSMAFLILSDMVSGAGSVIVMILGNVLIIGLEGLIVGIQGLRLVYYELFSRFYKGDGKAYEPIGSK